MWKQFRRLLLGTVVEILLEVGLDVRLRGLTLVFDQKSKFEVPRLDNYMRFKGHVDAPLETQASDAQLSTLREKLEGVWPDLLAVVDLPVGDRLTSDRNDIDVERTESGLTIRFDLEAD